ncbi:ribonuclease P protein component [Merdimmobilis hominis]|jgi:ribonuclease P protein component|uniref:Ribonuclease P protein component n=1 Tax=uncultured Anaerotruncus sp. TaxID=905011 RepID=A0A6N2UPY3_9FIRM|nr:ribonuclease P protein component [Merdimmobilis hominis]MCD4835253.1 ribonuclease P protein component [Merdimmobilis hominis]PWL56933.1 MAG: ribonuclease P protein component [Oscillospiraceae bacterium]PWL57185.1 MAG: ribonuclease P protein component [Oscillospiraceae bacterium]
MLHTVTLNQNRDFKKVYRAGKSAVHPLLVTYAVKNRKGRARVGITATKKIGKACKRNRARRIIREAYRQMEPTVVKGWDIVFVARGRTTQVKMQEVQRVMDKQLQKLGLLQKPEPSKPQQTAPAE